MGMGEYLILIIDFLVVEIDGNIFLINSVSLDI